jgi:hypothetical protein
MESEEALMADLEKTILLSLWEYLGALKNVRAAGDALNLTTASVYRLRRAGKLTAAPLPCGCVRFSPTEIRRCAESRANNRARRAVARDCTGRNGGRDAQS